MIRKRAEQFPRRSCLSNGFVNPYGADNDLRTRKTSWLVERRDADRLRTPGSWERSCVSKIEQSADTDPPEPSAPEGFLLPGAFRDFAGEGRNGRPGSRGSRGNARAQARGACRRERGDEPDTDGRANSSEFAIGGASISAAAEFMFAASRCG